MRDRTPNLETFSRIEDSSHCLNCYAPREAGNLLTRVQGESFSAFTRKI